MITIFWPTLLIGVLIAFVSYCRMRDGISFKNRDKFEKWLMFSLIVLLLIDISLLIIERREMVYEMNDCIRFYRYFPTFYNDSDFYFVNQWCYEYFTDEQIKELRESGVAWNNQRLGLTTTKYVNTFNATEILKGGFFKNE